MDNQEITLLWTLPNGETSCESVALEQRQDGTSALRLSAESIRSRGAASLAVTPSFGHADKGEAGYWFSPYGHYGEWDSDEGRFLADDDRMNMPMFGWATSGGAWLAPRNRR